MAGQKRKNDKDITAIARKQRYLSLLKRVKSGQALSKAELNELEGYEQEFKDQARPQINRKKRKK